MKKMMKVTFIAILAISIGSATALAGGVSDGGGGTIIQDPAGTGYVADMLKTIRPRLLFFLKNTCGESDGVDYVPPCKGLYEGSETIFDKVKSVKIKIQTTESCYDHAGQPVDGSVNSDPGTICMSAFSIGKKVNIDSSFPQLMALLAHEYSHLLGYNEEQAFQFQKHCLQMLQWGASVNGGFWVSHLFKVAATEAVSLLNQAQQAIEIQGQPNKAYYLYQQATKPNLFPYISYYFPFDPKEAPVMQQLRMRIYNLALFGCAVYELDEKERATCHAQYEQIFAGAKQLPTNIFKQRYGDITIIKANGQITNLLKNPNSLLAEIKAIQAELSQMMSILEQQNELKD